MGGRAKGIGNRVRVISLIEPRIPSECSHRLTARFFLNLRYNYYHKQTSTLGSCARSSQNLTVHNRPIHKLLVWVWTDLFVDLGTDPTVYSNRHDLNDRSIEQEDIIDLKELESQG